MKLYKTRKTASKHGLKYYQGKQCVNGHNGVRYTNCNRCVECMSKRYTHLLRATPKWVTKLERLWIRDLFDMACDMSNSDIQYSVDHYYPLLGTRVCGLHTLQNLVIIPHKENMEKKNKHPDVFYSKQGQLNENTNYERCTQ